jgi:DNA-3-methyladenine glycosylase
MPGKRSSRGEQAPVSPPPSRPGALAPVLPQSFYARDALAVARDLLGKVIECEGVVLRITEVEAYRFPDDTANHCRVGRTERNASMWGPPGHAYVYRCYGLHNLLNLVTNREGEGAAVLIRSCEPIAGLPQIQRRRGMTSDRPVLLAGPGKIGQALGVDPGWCHHPLFVPGGLCVRDAAPVTAALAGPRVGIDYALPADRAAPYRFAVAGTRWVSVPGTLRPV